MQKVYLLLRQNQQTGPFSLDELLRFHLTPYDLIWIEGRSAGWYYPQEIEALQPHLNFLTETPTKAVETFVAPAVANLTEPTTPKKIFVSMPAQSAKPEAKQEPVTATSVAPAKADAKQEPLVAVPAAMKEPLFAPTATEPQQKTVYAKSMEDVETDYINRAYQKKAAKKKPLFSRSGLVVLCLVAGGLFAAYRIANTPKAEDSIAPASSTVAVVQPDSLSAENDAAETTTAKPQRAALVSTLTKGKKERSGVANKPAIASQNTEAVAHQPTGVVEKEASNKAVDTAPESAEQETVSVNDGNANTETAEAPKKKKLRDKIFDVFRKKPEDKKEETAPAETGDGRRSSTRREAGSSLTQLVAVRFTTPNDWMMGIHGAKATLTNKSSETLAKAVVEVVYYNDDNEVLMKKTVTFGNVKSKQSQTVSVPEHATATRLEYNVVSAVGMGEPVAAL